MIRNSVLCTSLFKTGSIFRFCALRKKSAKCSASQDMIFGSAQTNDTNVATEGVSFASFVNCEDNNKLTQLGIDSSRSPLSYVKETRNPIQSNTIAHEIMIGDSGAAYCSQPTAG